MRRPLALVMLALTLLAGAILLLAYGLGHGLWGEPQLAGQVAELARSAVHTRERVDAQRVAIGAIDGAVDKQILFGDLHVHSTFSTDAFMLGLPMYQGEGAHPPADACDFARFCSALDFWSINDHAEALTPTSWRETKETIRQCNAVAGESEVPDLVSFLGWEWTQIGATPDDHYGHKNVVLRDTAEDRVPTRPIASRATLFPESTGARPISKWMRGLLVLGSPGSNDRQPYHDLALFLTERERLEACPADVAPEALPTDCREGAATPAQLFAKLDAWGFPNLVIPHGNAWGIYTPRGSSWDHQLAKSADPTRTEPLLEIFSGHGNSEEYRPWRAIERDTEGRPTCPAPSRGYLPECWRAGEIIEARCLDSGIAAAECSERAAVARQHHAEAGLSGRLTVPGTSVEDWLEAGQCTDCYLPAYRYRPGGSSQYALAISNFDDPKRPKRFRFGFLASSDGHKARPGTGYKEVDRPAMSDAGLSQMGPPPFLHAAEPAPHSVPIESLDLATPDFERSASFFGTGGLVAVHARGRDREAIWQALEDREVYGTSGDRILLYFDWVSDVTPADDGASLRAAMGSEILTGTDPTFEVKALGALEQQPGCPDYVENALGTERFDRLCRGECYHPSDVRKPISHIEVVRVRPQIRPDEPVEPLVEDPWLVLPCPRDGTGCRVRFSDPEYALSERDATYYVRAIQVATPTINAAGLRCERDAAGGCIATDPCEGGVGSDPSDDCLADAGERAWSSPIYLVQSR